MAFTDGALGQHYLSEEEQRTGVPAPLMIPAQASPPPPAPMPIAAPAPMPMPAPAPAIPPEVSVSPAQAPKQGQMQTTGSSTTVASGKLSTESKQVLDDRKRLTGEAIETERRVGELQGQQADARATAAANLYKVEEDFGAQQQRIIAESQKRAEAKRAEIDKAVEERKKAKFTDFF